MGSTAHTRQRKGINPRVAVKAERGANGQKAETGLKNTRATTGRVDRRAMTKVLKTKRSQIKVKIKTRVRNPAKNTKTRAKTRVMRELEQSLAAKKEHLQRPSVGPAAEAGIEADAQGPEIRRRKETRTKRGAETAAGVRTDDTTAKRRAGGARLEINDQEVQTETERETPREAGAPEAGVVGETTAKSGPLTEENAEGDEAAAAVAAAALIGTEQTKRRVKAAPEPRGAQRVPPEREGAQPNQTVRKAKRKAIRRASRLLAPARTQTDALCNTQNMEYKLLDLCHHSLSTSTTNERLDLSKCIQFRTNLQQVEVIDLKTCEDKVLQ